MLMARHWVERVRASDTNKRKDYEVGRLSAFGFLDNKNVFGCCSEITLLIAASVPF